MNFYVYVPEAIRTDKTEVVFTWEGNRKDETMKEIVVPWNEYIEKDGFYKFSCNVCAAEMNDEITAELYHDGKLLETNAFSVREYGRVILNDVTWIAKYKEHGKEFDNFCCFRGFFNCFCDAGCKTYTIKSASP